MQIFLPGQRLANQCFTMHKKETNYKRKKIKLYEKNKQIKKTWLELKSKKEPPWSETVAFRYLENPLTKWPRFSDNINKIILKHWAARVARERKHLECTSTKPSVRIGTERDGTGRDGTARDRTGRTLRSAMTGTWRAFAGLSGLTER